MTPHQYLEANQQRMIGALQDLVRVATVNPPGHHYQRMVEMLQERCEWLGMKAVVHRVPDKKVGELAAIDPGFPRFNLVARWEAGAPQTVHFNAHYDVVPAAGQWKFGSPFEPGVRQGRVYGRGSGDMKGSIVALLMAVESLQRTGYEPAFNIECSFTADEETGGHLGAGFIVQQGLVAADYVVVCEGGSGTRIGCGHHGVLWFEVEIKGKAAHASRPESGVNAFQAMAELVFHFQGFSRQLAMPGRRFIDFDGDERFPTLTIGGVFAGSEGDKVNTVPGQASFSIDRRVLPNEHLREAEGELRQAMRWAAGKVPQAKCRTDTTLRIAPCVVRPEYPLPQSFARAVRRVRRRPARFGVTRGFTDLHYFVEEGGFPGIGYGVKGCQAHGMDEQVEVRDLLQTARVYAEFMLGGVQPC